MTHHKVLHRIIASLALTFTLLSFGGMPARADDSEAYTKVLDRLTSVEHFSDRPVLFIVGFDTTKSMSVEFDRAKRVTQLVLSRYGAPGDSIYIFGFANKPIVLPATASPKLVPAQGIDSVLATLNEGILGLPRSSEFGTVFGRAKLFALEKAKEFGSKRNVVVMLFSDNNSELEMGTDERKKLESMESTAASQAETIPLLSQGVSPLWMTLYTNKFPDTSPLPGPDGETDGQTPRLAWAARRMGSQTLQFIEPASTRVESLPVDVSVQFLGPVQPEEATLTVDGKQSLTASFEDGRATWKLDTLAPGSRLLVAQAILPDAKVRTAELQVTVAIKAGTSDAAGTEGTTAAGATGGKSPTPPAPSGTPKPPTDNGEGFSAAPLILLAILAAIGGGIFLLSTRPARVRVIGPRSEESFVLPKGRTLRLGGGSRVEGDLVYADASLSETVAEITATGFGKARVAPNAALKDGNIEIETDEGTTVVESGEPLLTTATVTWTSARGLTEVYSLVKEDGATKSVDGGGHFGGDASGSSDDDGADWRA